jgi:hypothetical protein
LHIPRRDRFGDVVWQPATTTAVYSILENPAYAGAFVRGRRQRKRGGGVRRVPQTEWAICVRDKYPAYIDWATFEQIQAMLRDNHADYLDKGTRGLPRRGQALLSGLLCCGECGHRMSVHYRSDVHYACHFLRSKYQTGPSCQRVAALALDRHVAEAFLEALAPAELEALVRARTLMAQEYEQVQQARQQQLDRLRYQAQLAERQYNRADPDNRLVAAELERRWEIALREVRAAEEAWQREGAVPASSGVLDADTQQAFAEEARKITQMWQEDLLAPAQKKALLRCLVEKVVVRREGGDRAEVRIVWRGGATSTALVAIPAASWSRLTCAGQVEETVLRLTQEGKSDQEMAEQLTQQGCRSPRTTAVSVHMVRRIRLRAGIVHQRTTRPRRSVPGWLTVTQLAERLEISINQIYDRIYSGKIEVGRDVKWKMYLFPDRSRTLTMIRKLLEGKVQTVRFKGGHQDG